MVGKIKSINTDDVTLEFADGSIKSVPFELLPHNITLDDLINLSISNVIPNEKYIDSF